MWEKVRIMFTHIASQSFFPIKNEAPISWSEATWEELLESRNWDEKINFIYKYMCTDNIPYI